MNAQNYCNIIQTLDEAQFRELARMLLMEKERTDDVRITDGPWDGGCDLTIYRGGRLLKKTIQATVQKKDIDAKFLEDLDKAEKNVRDKGFMTGFYFFISQPVSQGKQNEWDSQADAKNIELTVYDAKALAEASLRSQSMSDFLREVYTGEKTKPSLDEYIRDKNLYDILALGRDANDIKLGFLKSFSMVYLFDNPGSTIKDIKEYVDSKYHEEVSELQLKRALRDCACGEEPSLTVEAGKYDLTDRARVEFENVRNQSCIEEKEARDGLEEILKDAGLETETDRLFGLLGDWFRSQYVREIDRMERGSHGNIGKSVENRLKTFLLSLTHDDRVANSLTDNICEFLTKNHYFNKLGRSHLFHTLLSKGAIDSYLDVFNKTVFLDTQVLLQLVCVTFAPDLEYRDFSYNALRELWRQKGRMKNRLRVCSTTDYLDEVANHLADARRLRLFIDGDDFGLMGGSRNVFVNFFIYLRDYAPGFGYDSFDEFLEELLGTGYSNDMRDKEFISFANRKIYENLDGVGIELKAPLMFAHQVFQNEMSRYEKVLYFLKAESKTKHSKRTDLNMMLMLDSEDVQNRVVGDKIVTDAPFLVTWDNTFAKCLEKYSEKRELSRIKGNWYVYSPSMMADRLSLATLELDPESVNYDVIRHAEGFYYNGQSFLDLLVKLVNPENNTRFVRKMLDMKKEQLAVRPAEEEKELRNENKTEIDKVLAEIYRYYSVNKKYNLDNIAALIEGDDTFNPFADIIDYGCEEFLKTQKISPDIFERINQLIEKS